MTIQTASDLAALPENLRNAFLRDLGTDATIELKHNWRFWALPHQRIIDKPVRTTLFNAGRGAGKTWYGSNWTLDQVDELPDGSILHLIGETLSEVHEVMCAGPSGIAQMANPLKGKVRYFKGAQASEVVLEFWNGTTCKVFTGHKPEKLRGPQCHGGWFDELAKYKYPEKAYEQYKYGCRLGEFPQTLITTTPRPIALMRKLLAHPKTVVLTGSTYANAANLAPSFIEEMEEEYEGTRMGLQELHAQMLDDNPNALWQLDILNQYRVDREPEDFEAIVIGVDPPVTDRGDACGIVAAGTAKKDGHHYVLGNHTIKKPKPLEWAKRAVNAYHHHQANRITAEVNQGGQMVLEMIKQIDPSVPVKMVRASRGKMLRAEPVAMLYEQGKVHHVGHLASLEDQMLNYDGETNTYSPDDLDALVWAISDLKGLNGVGPRIRMI
jgi:predicted phage terminase large subunit-like protein